MFSGTSTCRMTTQQVELSCKLLSSALHASFEVVIELFITLVPCVIYFMLYT